MTTEVSLQKQRRPNNITIDTAPTWLETNIPANNLNLKQGEV